MSLNRYIFYNGGYTKREEFSISLENRAFLYGDALFETIHANGTEPQFIDLHFKRLIAGTKVLKMKLSPLFTSDFLKKTITSLLTRNKLFKGARIRLTVYRNPGGLYSPADNSASFVIESTKLDDDLYIMNPKGYMVDIYEDIRKPLNVFANLKSTNSLLYVMAGLHKNELGLDDCLLKNEKNMIIESISSNIFIVKEKKIYTPAVSEGCLPGIMRHIVINILKQMNYSVDFSCSLTLNDITLADELFLTNAISGIRWVLGFKQKRYFHKVSEILINQLNKLAFPDY